MTKIDIGIKVKCISNEFSNFSVDARKKGEIKLPKKGINYTVKEIYSCNSQKYITVNEISNPHYFHNKTDGFVEPFFEIEKFFLHKK